MMARRGGQALVAREERRIKRFGERDIDGIVSREIGAQFPDTWQKDAVRVSAQGKVRQIGKSRPATVRVDLAICRIFTHDLCYFDVEQMGRVQCLLGSE